MPQPNVKDLLVSGPLANVSVAYRNRSYIADRVYPIIDTSDPKCKITRFLKGAWFRDEAAIRGPGARAARGGYPIDFISVSTDEYAFAKEVTDEDRRFAKSSFAPPLQPDTDALEYCADRIDLRKEKAIASQILAGTWSGVAGEDAEGLWAAGTGNTFITDVETRIETIRGNTGIRPNKLILSANTLKEIKQESTVLERIKYTERGIVTAQLLASLFGLDEVLIGDAIYSSAAEKADGSDFTAVNVWEKTANKGSAFLFYAPSRPGLKTPSAGYQVRLLYENGQQRRTTTWREADRHQDVYEVAEETDIVQTGSDLGFLWYDTIVT
jgi:hypothetical protein